MHVLFSLLRIKGVYMFRALFAHPQEALHNVIHFNAAAAKNARHIPTAVHIAPSKDEQVMLETCRGP
jgi:hypothetical protein